MSFESVGFEGLEDRLLLAGNVSVAFNAVTGVLTITGDNASNDITISDDDADGVAEIHGNGTNIIDNGGILDGAGNLTVGPVVSVVVNMNNGNDTLTVDANGGANLLDGQNATVNMGNGNDRIFLEGEGADIVLTNVRVYLGAGNDLFVDDTVNTDPQFDSLGIDGGAGNDQILLTSGGLDVDTLGINGGAGNDTIALDGIFALGNAPVSTANVFGGTGNDLVNANDVNLDGFKITMDGARDHVIVSNSTIAQGFSITGGNGKDLVELYSNTFNGNTFISGRRGRDTLVVDAFNAFNGPTTIDSFESKFVV